MPTIMDILENLREKARKSWTQEDDFGRGYLQALRDIQSIIEEPVPSDGTEQLRLPFGESRE